MDAVNHNRYDKPGEKIPVTSSLMIKGEPLKYVSRGGLKLEKALKEFDVSVDGKILLDIGCLYWWIYRCGLTKWCQTKLRTRCGV